MTDPIIEPVENAPVIPSQPKRRKPLLVVLLAIIGVLLVLFIGIQFIPVNHTNPPVTSQINWDLPATETLARQACMDCHSNETVWPWYSYVAPVSWLVYYDVERGRSQMNLSTYSAASGETHGNPFDQRSGDLAYTLGQFLSGGNRLGGPGGFGDRGGFPPGGQFPTLAAGQQPPAGGFPGGGFGGGGLGNQITQNINNGAMPPGNYLMLHPAANLTDAEKQQLVQGLIKSLGLSTGQ